MQRYYLPDLPPETAENINEPLIATLEKDLNKYESGLHNPASDRYMALIYLEMATAADYIPDGAVVAVCDHGNLQRASRQPLRRNGNAADSMLGAGLVAGELCDYVCQWEDSAKLSGRKPSFILMPSAALLPGGSPQSSCTSSPLQLPGYGGNLTPP